MDGTVCGIRCLTREHALTGANAARPPVLGALCPLDNLYPVPGAELQVAICLWREVIERYNVLRSWLGLGLDRRWRWGSLLDERRGCCGGVRRVRRWWRSIVV